MKLKVMLWIFVFLILTATVLGLGIQPAQTKINFAPGKERETFFRVINDDRENLNIKVYVEGELAKFAEIELEETGHVLTSEDESTEVWFKIKFPDELPKRELIGDIIVQQDMTSILGADVDASISANLQLVYRIYVNANIPDKFIEADLEYEDKGDTVEIITDVKNFGLKEINKVQSFLTISEDNKEIKKLQTGSESLLPNAEARLRADFNKAEVTSGEYTVAATVEYDEKRLNVIKEMIVGVPEMELFNFQDKLISGRINDYKFDIKNLWNKAIQNMYVAVAVYNGSIELYSGKTQTFDLNARGTRQVDAFVDATQIKEGTYDLLLKVFYLDKSSEKKFQVKFFEREEDRDKSVKGSKLAIYFVVFALTVIILLVVIIIILARRQGPGRSGGYKKESSDFKTDEGWG